MIARRRRGAPWTGWPREKLLDLRISQLGVRLEGTWLEECLEELYADLARRGLRFRPHAWLSTDWFSPGDIPGIAIPFYLAHPRLVRLERREMLEVEGGTREECLRILRHECGHAVQHAWLLHRRKTWQRHFGRSSTPYPDVYTPNPGSRRYVQHLRLYYAQSHPDEDFAETFAVWLQPRATWRRRYAGWPALRKLEYVDGLVAELAGAPPRVRSRARVEPVSQVALTLRDYYAEKKQKYAVNFPDVYDRDLRRLFSDDPRHRNRQRASAFLRRHRAELRRTVARWTGEYEFALDQVLNDIIGRCRELGLRAVGSERRLLMDAAGMLAVKTVHHLYSRRVAIAL